MNALARLNPFGPHLGFELTRLARKRRLILWRTLYALVLAAIVIAAYVALTENRRTQLTPHELAELTQGLFFGLFALQAGLVCTLTPRLTADAIANEKERQTLPFLLLTDLSSREIILGKLAARLAQLLQFLLAGLPILVVLQFLGGIEPLLVMICYAALAVTILSVGCLSILCSVYGRTSKAAGQLFGRAVGLYVLLLIVGGSTLQVWPAVAAFPGSPDGLATVSVQDLFDLLNVGNPLAAVQHVVGGWRTAGSFGDVLWPTARDYLLFHLAVAGVCGTWAVRRLRPVAAGQGDGPPQASKRAMLKPVSRPPIGDRPVLWKALYCDIRQYRSPAGRMFTRIVFVLSFAPVTVVLIIDGVMNRFIYTPEAINVVCRMLVTVALCGMLVIIASLASACIARERHKRTLDDLLLTDLSTTEILAQKWLGSVGAIRWGLVWVGVHWLLGVMTGGLHFLAVPLLALEWAAYAAATASLGIYFAARMQTAQQANVGTGLVGFAAVALPLLVGLLLLGVAGYEPPHFLLPLSTSPPAALGLTAFSFANLAWMHKHPHEVTVIALGAAAGVVASALMAARWWRGACWWFARKSVRM